MFLEIDTDKDWKVIINTNNISYYSGDKYHIEIYMTGDNEPFKIDISIEDFEKRLHSMNFQSKFSNILDSK